MIQFFCKKDITSQPLALLFINSKVKELNTRYKNKCCDCHPAFQWTASVELSKGRYTITEVVPEEIQPCGFLKNVLESEIVLMLNAVSA